MPNENVDNEVGGGADVVEGDGAENPNLNPGTAGPSVAEAVVLDPTITSYFAGRGSEQAMHLGSEILLKIIHVGQDHL